MPAQQSPEFKQAALDVKKLKAKPTNDELLELYALYKHGTDEESIDDAKAPSMFDFKEKAKRRAWQDTVDSGMSPADAQKKYVALVEELKNKHGVEA
ncbi:acyl CoA binding protein [Lineolata rhizophorae]|uniref:Acyl CoA binding protein n=1 Tax=Lineolata rhizophorae TaxID=578093 RepID=A0A6A6NV25_9PEZI|nr:acyl CoA binding protein [Lineolata rhizophorae]